MRTLTHNGQTLTIGQWSRLLGIPDGTIRSRIDKLGMSVADALTRPVDKRFDPAPAPIVEARPAPPLKRDDRGRAVARWSEDGARHKKIFGPWGKPETVASYNRWAAEWHSNQGRPVEHGEQLSVGGLVVRCLEWASKHYTKRGKPTSEVHGFRAALGTVVELYGATAANEFTATKLRTVQSRWIDDGKKMTTCNAYLSYSVRCWSWGVSRDLVLASVADALAHVPRLVPGRGEAEQSEPVMAVPEADYYACLPHLDPDPARQAAYSAICELQWHSGMRPGEVLELRLDNLDRTREPWLYRPMSGGKTLHHAKPRRVWIGPKGRAILAPWLAVAEQGQPVFRVPRHRNGKGMIAVRIEKLRAAIADACEIARVEVWTPNQLRHSKATEVQRIYEDDATVAAALGNSPEVARQVYVDNPADAAARRVAEELG